MALPQRLMSVRSPLADFNLHRSRSAARGRCSEAEMEQNNEYEEGRSSPTEYDYVLIRMVVIDWCLLNNLLNWIKLHRWFRSRIPQSFALQKPASFKQGSQIGEPKNNGRPKGLPLFFVLQNMSWTWTGRRLYSLLLWIKYMSQKNSPVDCFLVRGRLLRQVQQGEPKRKQVKRPAFLL